MSKSHCKAQLLACLEIAMRLQWPSHGTQQVKRCSGIRVAAEKQLRICAQATLFTLGHFLHIRNLLLVCGLHLVTAKLVATISLVLDVVQASRVRPGQAKWDTSGED